MKDFIRNTACLLVLNFALTGFIGTIQKTIYGDSPVVLDSFRFYLVVMISTVIVSIVNEAVGKIVEFFRGLR